MSIIEMLDKAKREHMALIEENHRLNSELVKAGYPSKMAKEVASIFVSPSMYAQAMRWIEKESK